MRTSKEKARLPNRATLIAWEKAATELMDQLVRNPTVLQPVARTLTGAMRAKRLADRVLRKAWRLVGLPTKQEQERTLHLLNELNSKFLDLEERIEAVDGHVSERPAQLHSISTQSPGLEAASNDSEQAS